MIHVYYYFFSGFPITKFFYHSVFYFVPLVIILYSQIDRAGWLRFPCELRTGLGTQVRAERNGIT